MVNALVSATTRDAESFEIITGGRRFRSRVAANAAWVHAETIARMVQVNQLESVPCGYALTVA